VVFRRGWHRQAWLSGQALAVYALALFGAPVVAWRRRRSDPALAGTLAVLWWTTAYALVTTSLVEIGENERFRAELGPVPTVVAVVVVTAAVRTAWSRRGRTGRRDAATAGPDPTPTRPT
jgi:ribose/xylose/arabinose/galactoside ABC-type transport system permease subunit